MREWLLKGSTEVLNASGWQAHGGTTDGQTCAMQGDGFGLNALPIYCSYGPAKFRMGFREICQWELLRLRHTATI